MHGHTSIYSTCPFTVNVFSYLDTEKYVAHTFSLQCYGAKWFTVAYIEMSTFRSNSIYVVEMHHFIAVVKRELQIYNLKKNVCGIMTQSYMKFIDSFKQSLS